MRRAFALLLALSLSASSPSLFAEDVATAPLEMHVEAPPLVVLAAPLRTYRFEAAATLGYVTVPIRGGVNPFATGFGARLGANLSHLYLGASVTDYLGGSDNGATDHALLAGVEVGYSGTIGRYFILRPQLGVGDTILFHTEPPVAATSGAPDVVTSASGVATSGGGGGSGGSPSETTTVKNIYVTPKLVALFGYKHLFCAASFGALIVPGILYGPSPAETTTWISYTFESQVGLRL